MATMRTQSPPTYLPPTREDMKVAAEKAGVKRFAPDLVSDLVNLGSGGKINPPSSYRHTVEEWADSTLPNANNAGEWSITIRDDSGSKRTKATKSRAEAIRSKTDERMRYHQAVCDFLRTLDIAGAPGSTPLEKAMSLLKLLATQKGGENTGGEDQEGESLPIFVDNDSPEGVAEKLNEAVDAVDSMSEEEKILMTDEQDSSADSAGKDGGDPTQARELAKDMLKGKDKMLEISRHLKTLSRMQVRRQKKLETDPDGDEVRYRPMKHLGEIGKIPQAEWALPKTYRMYRHVTGQTQVRERVTRIEKKQLLYMIIDCSGSMGSGQRIYKAGGILMNRLEAVIEGEVELYVRLFDTDLKQEYHASTPEEARQLMKKFTDANYSGRGTNISGCAKAAQKRINEIIAAGAMYRPELVIVTDGQDDTSTLSLNDFPGTKLHAFVVECKNQSLTRLAERSGGVGVEDM